MKSFILGVSLCLLSFFGMAQAAELHTVKAGETLVGLAGKDWKMVCKANNLADCNLIRVGQKLNLTGTPGLPAGQPKVFPPKAQAKVTEKPEVCKVGDFCWLHYNTDPYKPHRTAAKDRRVLESRGWSSHEIAQFHAMQEVGGFCTPTTIKYGDRFAYMLFGNGKVKENVVVGFTATRSGVECVLVTGRVVVVPDDCDNIAEREKPEPIVPRPEEPAPPEITTGPLPKVPTDLGDSFCPLDPKLVVGQEHEPEHSGNAAHSTFLSGALYCTWRGKKGTHGIGVGTQSSWWHGTVNNGVGRFEGSLLLAGPGYEYISDEHWDVEVKLLFGRLDESFKQGDYESSRHFDIGAISGAYNWYEREMEGEKAFAKTQLFGILGVPLSRDAEHSWQGQSIADTSQLEKLGLYFNAGVRQEIYNFDIFKLYADLGYFLETPVAESGSFRIGITDPNSICGIGIGFDHDFKSGGNPFAWGWWCDPVRGIKVLRAKHRASQIEDIGVTKVNGIIMVPLTEGAQPNTPPVENEGITQGETVARDGIIWETPPPQAG